MDITTATPAQIDTEIARLNGVMQRSQARMEQAVTTIARIDKASTLDRSLPWNSQAKYDEAVAERDAATVAYRDALAAAVPLNEEFTRRGGWTRFYLVTNTGGHVHWTTACGTCFPTTQFAWLTEYSGMARDAFVEEAGSKACTVCFPDAPVEVYSRATRIKYESEEAKARREERETKAAAKAAAEVVVEGYMGYSSRPQTKTFKSVRAVTNDIAGDLSSLCWYGEGHPSAAEWINNIEQCRKALAAKGAEYDYDKALTNARRKVTKDGGSPKF
jgi:hypothetical protein